MTSVMAAASIAVVALAIAGMTAVDADDPRAERLRAVLHRGAALRHARAAAELARAEQAMRETAPHWPAPTADPSPDPSTHQEQRP